MESQSVIYVVTAERAHHRDIGYYVTHGIAALPSGVEQVRDVSTSFETAERLASQFNRLGLSPVHLRDAVRDAVAGDL
jgi:hypothetical protein